MSRVRCEIAVVGSGQAAILAAHRLRASGRDVALVNPAKRFVLGDVRECTPQALWQAAFRQENETSPTVLYEELCARVRELLPAPLETIRLRREELWSVMSSTFVHRAMTEEHEREFFRLERRSWSAGHCRLVTPEHVHVLAGRAGLDLDRVAEVDGAMVRTSALTWDPLGLALALAQYLAHQQSTERPIRVFSGAKISARYGRRLDFKDSTGEEIQLESEAAMVVLLTGDVLPMIRNVVATCEEPWIQGVRKRRRERHCVRIRRKPVRAMEPVWLELGELRYRVSAEEIFATWASEKGPDGLERVVDEVLRMDESSAGEAVFYSAQRMFQLEWDWKAPQWRDTSHNTFWATAFEGDLWNLSELLWKMPSL